MSPWLKSIVSESDGAAMIEFAAIAGLLIFLTFGIVDFSLAFFQWNAATKAVERGARLAAVSDPVSSDLATYSGLEGGGDPGDYPPPSYERVCSGASASCTGGTYDANAMNTIVFGRGSVACRDGGPYPGMCDIFPQIQPQNVIIRYSGTGLGYVARPLGPVPTITVEVTGLTFNFFLLNGVLGLSPIPMPRLHTTMTGEDLATSGT